MGLDPFLTSTSDQGLHVPLPLWSISWEADQRREASTNKPHSRRAAGPALLCTMRSVETPVPLWEQEAEGGLAKPSILDTRLSSGPKRRVLPLAAQARQGL